MLSLELHLRLAGLIMIALGVAHAFFGPRLKWKEELERVSLLNRQIFYVHTFFIALIVLMLGVLSLCYAALLIQPTPLARVLLRGIVIFWGCRLVIQFVWYDASLWRGHRFNTAMHVLFSFLWIYLFGVFAWALWQQWN